MAEEIKQEEKKIDSKKAFSTFLKIILGVVFLALGIGSMIKWWTELMMIVKGSIGLFLLLFGIIILAIAKE